SRAAPGRPPPAAASIPRRFAAGRPAPPRPGTPAIAPRRRRPGRHRGRPNAVPPGRTAASGRPCSGGTGAPGGCPPCTPGSATTTSDVFQVEEGVGQFVAGGGQLRPLAVGQGDAHALHQALDLGAVLRADAL